MIRRLSLKEAPQNLKNFKRSGSKTPPSARREVGGLVRERRQTDLRLLFEIPKDLDNQTEPALPSGRSPSRKGLTSKDRTRSVGLLSSDVIFCHCLAHRIATPFVQ